MSKTEIYSKIVEYLKHHNAQRIAVFGSYARDEEIPSSDIDLIVDFKDKKDILEIIGIQQDLEETVGKKVDLISDKAIKPNRRKYIESSLKILHG